MTIRTLTLRLGLAAALAVTLSACETTGPKVAQPQVPKLEELMSRADQEAASGNKEKAIATWKEGASHYQSDKTPWSRIAKTRYDAGQYGDAIQAALEVLVRDPNDTEANSIIAISGLRLSTRALADLSRQNNLNGSTRTDAEQLAKILRENLGERVLVKTDPTPTHVDHQQQQQQQRVMRDKRGRIIPPPKGPGTPATPAAAAASSSASDPFGSLK